MLSGSQPLREEEDQRLAGLSPLQEELERLAGSPPLRQEFRRMAGFDLLHYLH